MKLMGKHSFFFLSAQTHATNIYLLDDAFPLSILLVFSFSFDPVTSSRDPSLTSTDPDTVMNTFLSVLLLVGN